MTAPASSLPPAASPKSPRRWLKIFACVLGSVVLLAVLATGGLWWWAGTDGSLATGMRWVAQSQPLQAEGATGSLRAGGQVRRLLWQQDGLVVEANDVAFAWRPWSLLHGTLKLDRLSAARVWVNDSRPPSATPARPPDLLGLPLQVALDDFTVARLEWAGPTPWQVRGLAGNYGFNGLEHELLLKNAQVASGQYQGRATLGARQPLQLDASLEGTLQATVPDSMVTLPLSFTARAKGPLIDLAVHAALQMTAGMGTPTLKNRSTQPHATATARVTAWAAQPVPRADASFQALDLAMFWPGAPQTRLTGNASIRPVTGTATNAGSWALQTQMVNALPGPWDQHRLPLENLQADGEWRGGAAVVRQLKAAVGGGEMVASGEWLGTSTPTASAAATSATHTAAPLQDWKLDATLQHVNPGAIHTQFAAVRVDGKASVRSLGTSVGFDASVQAVSGNGIPAAPAKNAPNGVTQLRLRDASATGSWNPDQNSGTLVLSALRVRTDDAELSGSLEAQPAARGGKGKLALAAPGLDAQVQGELRQASGLGSLSLDARDATQALRWLQKLPGMPDGIKRASVSGRATLQASWQGGWQDPTLQATLNAPSLDWRAAAVPAGNRAGAAPPTTAAATQTSTVTASTPPVMIKLRGVEATVAGKLSQAQVSLQGRAEDGTRRYAVQAAAEGGRVGGRAGNWGDWASSTWQSTVRQFSLSLEDPALGTGAWQLVSRAGFTARWSAAQGARGTSGTLETSAGEAVLAAPARTSQTGGGFAVTPSQAQLAWQPIRWRGGELTTAGKLTGLPLAWIELFAGPQMAGAGLTGNLVFDGSWDAVLGDTLRVKASLARASGDIIVQGESSAGATARVAAGVREARLSLDSAGDALTLALRWDSERAGTADGQLKTQLARDGAGGWAWPVNAPISGQLRAQLPRIGVWSVLAPPGWRLRGALATSLAISGTRGAPQLAGELQANDLALRSVVDGIEFGNGRLRARLDGARMLINEFTLQGAATSDNKGSGGTLTARGEAAWVDGQPRVQLDAVLDHLRASIRTDRQVTLSGNLQAQLAGKLTQFVGALKVDQARILLPEEGTPQLGDDVVVRSSTGAAAGKKAPAETGSPQTTASSKPAAASPQSDGRAIKLAVQLDLGNDFRVQGKGIDTRIRGKLALTGDSLFEPRLVGTVNTFGGQYRAYGQRLDVEQGLLRFTGAIDNPALDILAVRPNLTQRVGVQITGTALLPRVRLYAQPELPDAEKLSWLVVGRASASGGAEAALLQQAALALLGSKGGGMSGGLAASLGLDELSFRGSANNTDGTTTEGAVTLGKRFSRNFYAAYERSISGALGTLFVFYDLSQRFTVRAQTGEQSAVDLIFTIPYD